MARVVRARAPARRLVGHPADRLGADPDQIAVAQLNGPGQQAGVVEPGLQPVTGEQTLHQPVGRLLPALDIEVGGQRHDNAPPDPLGLRRLLATLADADLHLGRRRGDAGVVARRRGAGPHQRFRACAPGVRAAGLPMPVASRPRWAAGDRSRRGGRRRTGSRPALWPTTVTEPRTPAQDSCVGECRTEDPAGPATARRGQNRRTDQAKRARRPPVGAHCRCCRRGAGSPCSFSPDQRGLTRPDVRRSRTREAFRRHALW